MGREIEFRGKSAKNKLWVYGSLILDRFELVYIQYLTPPEQVTSAGYTKTRKYKAQVMPETVGQWIYKNKYGNFYEGDICYSPDFQCNFTIVYDGFKFWAKTDDGGLEDLEEYLDKSTFIVGNIHDDPEILGVQNDNS